MSFSPSLFDRTGFWAFQERSLPWRATNRGYGRPLSRDGYRFVGPFKTKEMAQAYADDQNKAAAKGVRG